MCVCWGGGGGAGLEWPLPGADLFSVRNQINAKSPGFFCFV